MTSRRNDRILLLGFPAAGKTTFLAVFWVVLENGASSMGWKLAHVHGNQEYLNRIRDAWGRCEPAERTGRGPANLVSIMVETDKGTLELVLPDVSGETFEEQWTHGRCTKEYVDFAQESQYLLFFVNPDKVDEGLGIRPIVEAAAAAGGPAGMEGNSPLPWKAKFAGTQVQLVEMLQILQRQPFVPLHRKIAVIVSAWDRVEDLGLEPKEWLAQRLPLFHQYLFANPDLFEYKVFGVSAQGGDFTSEREGLLEYVRPWERVIVREGNTTSRDLTTPVRWLIEG